jgi:hypothetical protein
VPSGLIDSLPLNTSFAPAGVAILSDSVGVTVSATLTVLGEVAGDAPAPATTRSTRDAPAGACNDQAPVPSVVVSPSSLNVEPFAGLVHSATVTPGAATPAVLSSVPESVSAECLYVRRTLPFSAFVARSRTNA